MVRRHWIEERAYADLVALCQFLPGPASSQVGIGIGLAKAGLPGALAAWLAFTTPSAIALAAFGYGVVAFGEAIPGGVLHGLKVVAVAVVAQAVWGMARTLCPDAPRITLAVLAAAAVLASPTPLIQVAVIAAGGIAGLVGDNAAVVGLLLAALYDPVWTSGILAPRDFALALAAFILLVFWKVPPWLVVVLTAAGGWAIQALA